MIELPHRPPSEKTASGSSLKAAETGMTARNSAPPKANSARTAAVGTPGAHRRRRRVDYRSGIVSSSRPTAAQWPLRISLLCAKPSELPSKFV